MTTRRVHWWDCDRCGDRMAFRDTLAEAERDRDEHIKRCQPWAHRAPWERNVSTDMLTDYYA